MHVAAHVTDDIQQRTLRCKDTIKIQLVQINLDISHFFCTFAADMKCANLFQSCGCRTLVFTLTAVLVLLKVVSFHVLCFGFLPGWHTLLTFPPQVFAFWLPKMAVALLFAAPVFFSKRGWWTLIVLILLDLWCVANLTYFRANNLVLSLDAIRMAGNLDGFGGSIAALVDIHTWLFPLVTALYAIVLALLQRLPAPTKSAWWAGFATLLAAVLCSLLGGVENWGVHHRKHGEPFNTQYLNPFVTPDEITVDDWQIERLPINYIINHSIAAYSVNMVVQGIALDRERQRDVIFSDEDLRAISRAFRPQGIPSRAERAENDAHITPRCNLVFILVESLESWVLEMHDAAGMPLLPNIDRLRHERPDFYAPRLTSQVKHGVSGDGQMIVSTGLLPIQSGAACLLYGYNTFPNYASLYPHGVVLNPVKNSWNKSVTMFSYGYNDLRQPEDAITEFGKTIPAQHWWDEAIFPELTRQCREGDTLFCSFVLTLSSHLPFNMYDHNFDPQLAQQWPDDVHNYLGALRYMDHYLGQFLNYADSARLWDNTVLVITGDHTVFKPQRLPSLAAPARKAGVSLADGHNYVPLIIAGAGIDQDTQMDNLAFQMDVFPTILHLIGADEYSWQGFGINLLAPDILPNRQFTEEEAFRLSDMLIRSNFFNR